MSSFIIFSSFIVYILLKISIMKGIAQMNVGNTLIVTWGWMSLFCWVRNALVPLTLKWLVYVLRFYCMVTDGGVAVATNDRQKKKKKKN